MNKKITRPIVLVRLRSGIDAFGNMAAVKPVNECL
jgi:hypothetical protein